MTFNRCFLQCLRFRMYVNMVIKCLSDDFKQCSENLKGTLSIFSSINFFTENLYVYNHVQSHGIVV